MSPLCRHLQIRCNFSNFSHNHFSACIKLTLNLWQLKPVFFAFPYIQTTEITEQQKYLKGVLIGKVEILKTKLKELSNISAHNFDSISFKQYHVCS